MFYNLCRTLGTVGLLLWLVTLSVSAGVAQTISPTSASTDGTPGLSFRYVQTFGETGVAYLGDASHLNYPWGITATGNSLWVAEAWGLRLLNYTNTGAFVRSVGNAGSHFLDNSSIFFIADVAIDTQGDLWLAADYSQVIKVNTEGKVLKVLNGNGAEGDDFRSPISVALDGAGNVYVSDGAQWWTTEDSHHRIVIFDPNGNYLATIGDRDTAGRGDMQFRGPRHITIHQNLLYVADSGNHRVQIFDIAIPATPTFVATIGVTGETMVDNQHLNEPSGVAVDATFIYIADTYHQRLQIFNRSNYNYVATIGGEWGQANDQFSNPSDVTVDDAGNIFVADFVNTRVQQYNANRQYVRTYGVTRTPYVSDGLHYNRPFGVDVGNDGSIYIAEERGGRVVKLNAAGVPQWTAGQAGLKNDWDPIDGSFSDAVDVAVGPTNRVYVADRYGRRIQIFNPDGTLFHILYGNDEVNFEWVSGLDVAANGYLYVTNDVAHVLYVFDANLNPIATIGEPGVPGDDSAHLRDPWDVAVDSAGTIFVVERSNYRVKKCTRSGGGGSCIPWIGEIGVGNNDFGYFGAPHRLAIDSQGNLYVSHEWYSRVDVFNAAGAYLTSVGGSWGENSGQFREPRGVAVGPNGDLYVADIQNHRIQKFSPGVSGWRQTNINGFGDRTNVNIHTVAAFQGQLYAGTYNDAGQGAQLWKTQDGSDWTPAITPGFGITTSIGINHAIPFNNQFYVGVRNETEGAKIYRSSNGTAWDLVATAGFGDPLNAAIYRFAVFKGQLYAGTGIFTTTHGAEIWRSPSGDNGTWSLVVSNGFDSTNNFIMRSSATHNGYLYFGTQNTDTSTDMTTTGGIVIRSQSGDNGSWAKVTLDGFGDINNYVISGLASFNGYLYASTSRWTASGIQVWRCQTCDGPGSWEKVVDNGFDNSFNWGLSTLQVFGDRLYVAVGNGVTGLEVWQTGSGDRGAWTRVAAEGFGDLNNLSPYFSNLAIFNNHLYLGTQNDANGAELWMYTDATTGQVTPEAGGSLYNPTNGISLTLPANAVTTTVNLALQKLITPSQPLPADKVGLRYFTLTAQDSNGNPITHFNHAYTLTLTYTDEELRQTGADEATLTCFYFDQANQQWQDITSEPNTVANQVTCHANHLTEFTLAAGKAARSPSLFLPVIMR